MKALIQRVNRASVTVDGSCVGSIEQGILAYIGLGHDDTFQNAQRMIDKILTYRIFENESDPAKYDKLIDRQLERAAITSICGFGKISDGAVQVLNV